MKQISDGTVKGLDVPVASNSDFNTPRTTGSWP